MGLGYRTSRAMHADLDATSESVNRSICEAAFATRLLELSGVKAIGQPLTAALVRAIPAGLDGETPDERVTVAVANALFEERLHLQCIDGARQDGNSVVEYLRGRAERGMDDKWPRDVERAFSLRLTDMGEEGFDVMVGFCDRDDCTVIKPGEEDRTIAGLIDGDLEAIRRMLTKRK
jgi:hypothetical protein